MKKREITLQTGESPQRIRNRPYCCSTVFVIFVTQRFTLCIIRRDPEARVRFASMQSEVGKRLLKKAGA